MSPLGWVVTATFLHFASLYYLLPTLPLYVQLLGGSTSEIGLIVGAFSLASLLVRPFIGIWMDRSGRRGFLLAGAAVYVLASLAYWAVRSVLGVLLCRVFHAIGLAAFSTAAASLAADLAGPGRRGRTIGVFGLAQAGALAIGPGIGRVIQGALGYTGLFFATAGTAFAALLCALALPGDASPRQNEFPGAWARSRASLHAAAVPAALQFAASIIYGIIVSFVAVVARERGIEMVGMFFVLLALSSLGVRLVAGKVYDAWGSAVVLAPAFLALATAMALLAVAGRPELFLLAAVPAGLGIGSTHTTLMARVADRSTRESQGSSVAGFIMCWELGVGGGSILMGHLAEWAGFYVMFVVAASLPLLGLSGLPWLDDRNRGHPREDR